MADLRLGDPTHKANLFSKKAQQIAFEPTSKHRSDHLLYAHRNGHKARGHGKPVVVIQIQEFRLGGLGNTPTIFGTSLLILRENTGNGHYNF